MCKNLGTFVTQREKVGLITQACHPTVTGINESSLALRFPGGPRALALEAANKQMGRSMSYGILIYRVSPVRNSVIFDFVIFMCIKIILKNISLIFYSIFFFLYYFMMIFYHN